MTAVPHAAAHFQLAAGEMQEGVRHGRFLTWRLEHGSHYRWYVQENSVESAQPADSLPK